jgi:hypothetical protein
MSDPAGLNLKHGFCCTSHSFVGTLCHMTPSRMLLSTNAKGEPWAWRSVPKQANKYPSFKSSLSIYFLNIFIAPRSYKNRHCPLNHFLRYYDPAKLLEDAWRSDINVFISEQFHYVDSLFKMRNTARRISHQYNSIMLFYYICYLIIIFLRPTKQFHVMN